MSLRYLTRRLGLALVTLFVVSVVVFGVTQVLPGNAAVMILGEFATEEQLSHLERQLGLDRPTYAQYAGWLGGILSGQWGISLRTGQPVSSLVLQALGRSLLLALPTLLVVSLVAIPLGAAAALRRGSRLDLSLGVISYLGVSVPEFVTGTIFLVLLARPELGWFPAGGYQPFTHDALEAMRYLVLPVATLAVVLMAHISRQTRSEMVDVLQTEYVRTAVIKGLPRRVILIKHALRNALLPTITVIALDVGYLIGGILVVEEVFAYPGLGRLLVFAIQNRDLPLIQAGALLMATVYAAANLAADLLYAYLNPRILYV
jgi:peptide/nickel transport system permease protein